MGVLLPKYKVLRKSCAYNRLMSTYNQAQTWLNLLKARESQKQVLEAARAAQASFIANQEAAHMPHVIFTQEDVGHTQEETQRIQELYGELEKVPLTPVFAWI